MEGASHQSKSMTYIVMYWLYKETFAQAVISSTTLTLTISVSRTSISVYRLNLIQSVNLNALIQIFCFMGEIVTSETLIALLTIKLIIDALNASKGTFSMLIYSAKR